MKPGFLRAFCVEGLNNRFTKYGVIMTLKESAITSVRHPAAPVFFDAAKSAFQENRC